MTSGSSSEHSVPSPGSPRWAARSVSGRLPDFPWDALVPLGDRARAHPEGIVDLSVGTPVDPTPSVVRDALAGVRGAGRGAPAPVRVTSAGAQR